MRNRRWKLGAAFMLVVIVAASLVAGGSASSKADYRIAVVTDIGSLQDKGFNELANKGRIQLDGIDGFETRIYETKAAADRLPNLIAAANAGFDLVIGVGFLMFDPLDKIAPRFPNTKFAGVDVTTFLLSKPHPNYYGIQFAEEQSGYLAGYLASLQVTSENKGLAIGAVGANNVPPILRFMSGYIQGAKKANPKVKVFINFANDPTFSDQAKCKEQALNQIAKGARVVFQVAGQCGLGVVSAAGEKKVWAIGVDADQSGLGPQVMTSAIKKVDVSVVNIGKLLKAYPQTKGGRDFTYTLKSGSVGLGTISPKVSAANVAKTRLVERQIKKGNIKVVPILAKFK